MIYVEGLQLRLEPSDGYPKMGWYSDTIPSYFQKEVRDTKEKVKFHSKGSGGK